MADQIEQSDELSQLLSCSDHDGSEFSDDQLADPLAKFLEQLALEDAFAKTSGGSKPS